MRRRELRGVHPRVRVQSGRGHRPRGRGRDHASASKDHDSNHPDRNSVARVGELKSAKATVLTQQATFLESMLEDHEYVAVRAGVDASALAGTNGGDAGPPSADSTSVVLNRVHLASTVEQLRDLVVEERPELAEARDRLAVGMTRRSGAAGDEAALRTRRGGGDAARLGGGSRDGVSGVGADGGGDGVGDVLEVKKDESDVDGKVICSIPDITRRDVVDGPPPRVVPLTRSR